MTRDEELTKAPEATIPDTRTDDILGQQLQAYGKGYAGGNIGRGPGPSPRIATLEAISAKKSSGTQGETMDASTIPSRETD